MARAILLFSVLTLRRPCYGTATKLRRANPKGFDSATTFRKENTMLGIFCAEGVGFEPTKPVRAPVFETGAIDRYATLPYFSSAGMISQSNR